jgi:hypothetical protein
VTFFKYIYFEKKTDELGEFKYEDDKIIADFLIPAESDD